MSKGVVAVTGRITIAVVGDRLHATVPSGRTKTTYAITFYQAGQAARDVLRMLGEHEDEQARAVRKMPRKGAPISHG